MRIIVHVVRRDCIEIFLRFVMNTFLCLVSKVNGLNETRADLTEKDCKVLFPKQPIQLFSNSCQCADGAFFNGSMCGMFFNLFINKGTCSYSLSVVPYLHATFF